MSEPPRVSIGLPVYNGADYVTDAIESVLGQTFEDFELIISDNGSTDGTREICEDFAARDGRVRYYRNETNLGASPNFNRVFELSRGEYFLWLAHDDYYAPRYLEKCVEMLDGNPSVVLCYSRVQEIDAKGKLTDQYGGKLKRASSPEPRDRFYDLILVDHWCREVFGMMRREVLAKTKLIGNYVGSDRPLLAELSLRGPFHEIDEILFYSREHGGRSIREYEDEQSRVEWFDTTRRGTLVFPHWRLVWEYFKSVGRVPMSFSQRIACYTQVARWIRWYWRKPANDVAVALKIRLRGGRKTERDQVAGGRTK